MRIIAIDPGQKTGWAELLDGDVVQMGTLSGFEEVWDWLERLPKNWYDVIVVENFRIRPRQNFSWGEMPPIQIIGAIKFWAYHSYHKDKIVLQEPSVKGLITERMGNKKSSTQNHAMDAVAHGLYYWRKHGPQTGS